MAALQNTIGLGALGGTIGSVGGPVGTAIGAGVGATAGGIADFVGWLSGRNKNKQQQGIPGQMQAQAGQNGLSQISNLTGPQQQLQNSSINQALSLLQGGQPQGFQPIADQARANFTSKTVPSLAERFGNPGNESGSSALYGQLSGAGADLDRGLAALQAQYGQNQLGTLLQSGLRPSVDFTRQGPGGFETVAGDTAEWLPQLLAQLYQQYQSNPSSQPDTNFNLSQFGQQLGQSGAGLQNLLGNAQQRAFAPQQGFPNLQYNQLGGGR